MDYNYQIIYLFNDVSAKRWLCKFFMIKQFHGIMEKKTKYLIEYSTLPHVANVLPM